LKVRIIYNSLNNLSSIINRTYFQYVQAKVKTLNTVNSPLADAVMMKLLKHYHSKYQTQVRVFVYFLRKKVKANACLEGRKDTAATPFIFQIAAL
jgi:hypothetical protein